MNPLFKRALIVTAAVVIADVTITVGLVLMAIFWKKST